MFKPYASIGTNLLFFEKGEPTKDIWFYEHRVPEGQKAYSMTRPIKVEHLKPCVDWWGGAKRKGRVENEVAWRVAEQHRIVAKVDESNGPVRPAGSAAHRHSHRQLPLARRNSS